MQVCTQCLLEKNLSEFHKSSKSKTGYVKQCKLCRSLNMKTLYSESETRKLKIKNRRKNTKIKNRRFLSKYKAMCKCYYCLESEPIVLDLHHLNPLEKDADPSSLVNCSIETLKAEIRKCIVLCANCHRKVHSRLLPNPTRN